MQGDQAYETKGTAGPVFIVGMNGSGTTMLADALDNSPEVFVFPREVRMLPWLVENLARFGDLGIADNRLKLAHTLASFHAVRTVAPNLHIHDEEIAEPTFAGVVDAVYRKAAACAGKQSIQRWVEKSPMNLQYMRRLADLFPTAQFIHIYRDGRDVAQSNHRRWRKNPYWSIYRWSQVVPQGRLDGRLLGPDRYLEVCYEELTSAPEEGVRNVCAFLGLQYYPALLRSSMPFMNMAQPRAKVKSGGIVANSQKWRDYFAAHEVARLEQIAGKQLAALGYETANPAADYAPSYMHLMFWQFLDIGVQARLVLERQGVSRLFSQRLWRRFSEGLKYRSILRR